jgi:formiminoglutamase
MSTDWLEILPGNSRLILSIPHAGTEIPAPFADDFTSPWLARKDTDWWLPQLYGFAEELGATVIRTHISRSIIDVNRDPTGASLYPGMAVTEMCPSTTFDGEDLYRPGCKPDVALRHQQYFEPYHAAIAAEIARLRQHHPSVILYDCHSIRSRIPRLFEGALPNFNIGTNDGKSCDPKLTARIAELCGSDPDFSYVVNGRFKGGYITRSFGRPEAGIHAIQMELACRGYMAEPEAPTPETWPSDYDPKFASKLQRRLKEIVTAIIDHQVAAF